MMDDYSRLCFEALIMHNYPHVMVMSIRNGTAERTSFAYVHRKELTIVLYYISRPIV